MHTRNSDHYIEYVPHPPDFYDDDYGDEDQDENSYDDGEPYDFDIEEKHLGYNCG